MDNDKLTEIIIEDHEAKNKLSQVAKKRNRLSKKPYAPKIQPKWKRQLRKYRIDKRP